MVVLVAIRACWVGVTVAMVAMPATGAWTGPGATVVLVAERD